MKKLNYALLFGCFLFFASVDNGKSQTIIYEENFGMPASNILVQDYTGWQNLTVLYSGDGSCDIRHSNPSNGYSGASGGGNVMLNNPSKWFCISGLNTSAYNGLQLQLGMRKSTVSENGSNLIAEYSCDGNLWVRLPQMNSLPTGSGTTGWYLILIDSIPQCEDLSLKFSNNGNNDIRLDDIKISTTSQISTPYIVIHSPLHGNVYYPSVPMNISLENFVLGSDGILKINLSDDTDSVIRYIQNETELQTWNTPQVLTPGNYRMETFLLHMDSTSLTPPVSNGLSFSIRVPVVSAPTFNPDGGTFHAPVTVSIQSDTEEALIYYSTDGTEPDQTGTEYRSPLHLESTTVLKAIAVKEGMSNSTVSTARYEIRDTVGAVTLPFDISGNSEGEKLDITTINGFQPHQLGSSYADGSAKFEQAKAGNASLTVKMDSSPDSIHFEVRGRTGGSTPQAYEGIVFLLLESPDNSNWRTIARLTEDDIETSQYHGFSFPLTPETRYVKWFLEEARKGNTQLNNIRIGRYIAPPDSTSMKENELYFLNYYPNPVRSLLHIESDDHINQVEIRDINGRQIYFTSDAGFSFLVTTHEWPKGMYILKVTFKNGVIKRKIIKI